MKKFIKRIFIMLLIFFLFLGVVLLFTLVPFNIQLRADEFDLEDTISRETSTFRNNGSWWGHNQTKLATIGDVVFSFNYDNSNLEFGNSSDLNPYDCEFVYIKDKIDYPIGTYPCNRPGNVLTDSVRNKVYYFVVEPTGPASQGGDDHTNIATTKMYEYSFEPATDTVVLIETHIVTPSNSDGKIRQGVDIDVSGNIVIAFGTYDGYMKFYTFDVENRLWENYSYLSNYEYDSLMYASVAMKDLDHIYILAEQDTSNEQGTFYQYVKFFAYEDGSFTDHMIVDYRNHELAEKQSKLVINGDIIIYNDQVHMLAVATKFFEVTYYVYDNGELEVQDTSYMNSGTKNSKFFVLEDELYIAGMSLKFGFLFPTFHVYSVANESNVYTLASVVLNNYFYIDTNDNQLLLLLYSNKKGTLYYIDMKE